MGKWLQANAVPLGLLVVSGLMIMFCEAHHFTAGLEFWRGTGAAALILTRAPYLHDRPSDLPDPLPPGTDATVTDSTTTKIKVPDEPAQKDT